MASAFGTLWDRQTISRAGDDLTGVTLAAIAHSLPATNAQVLVVQMISKAALGHNPAVQLLGQRGNASQNTVGYAVASTASCPTVAFDAYCALLHTSIA